MTLTPKKSNPTHKGLNKNYQQLGASFFKLSNFQKKLNAAPFKYPDKSIKVGDDGVIRYLKGKAGKKPTVTIADLSNNKKFGNLHRNQHEGTDELFSTSSVREILIGISDEIKKSPLSNSDKSLRTSVLSDALSRISEIRIPTDYSGMVYAFTDTNSNSEVIIKMQHPTSNTNRSNNDSNYEKILRATKTKPETVVIKQARSDGLFDHDSDSSSNMWHTALDTARKEHISKIMEEVLKEPTSTIENVSNAVIRTSIEWTLNNFTAPITAENVFKYTRAKTHFQFDKNHPSIKEQIIARDELKARYQEYGGTIRTPEQSNWNSNSPWGINRNMANNVENVSVNNKRFPTDKRRDVSPFRTRVNPSTNSRELI